MKHMAQLEAAGLVKPSSDSKEEGAEVDIDFYITSVSALLKLIQVGEKIKSSILFLIQNKLNTVVSMSATNC